LKKKTQKFEGNNLTIQRKIFTYRKNSMILLTLADFPLTNSNKHKRKNSRDE